MAAGTTLSINPVVVKNLPYKVEDFAPITLATTYPFGIITQNKGPADIPALVAAAKAVVTEHGGSFPQTEAALRTLALTLGGLSTGIWVVAAVMGQWLARRALSPLTQMARSASAMTAADLGRLPVPDTRDELDELGRAVTVASSCPAQAATSATSGISAGTRRRRGGTSRSC